MPSEWNYHADGVRTALTTKHDLDGKLSTVTVTLDCFKYRYWTPEEVEQHPTKKEKHLDWDDEEELYQEFGDGANATMKFDVNDSGRASVVSVSPEDGDAFHPRHMPLLRAAARVVENLSDIDAVYPPVKTLADAYEGSEGIYIERIDG